MKKFFQLIRKSIMSPDGKESSTRIASYIILVCVIIFSLSFVTIEILNSLKTGKISNEGIIIFGMLLGHQLTLLGINKYHENKKKD